MRVLVTGGAGALGSQVVEELRRRGHEPRPASRRFGVDLATGEGLPVAVASAEAVVHCATRPLRPTAVYVAGTRRLAAEVSKAVVMPHLVYISIVGCDANPYPYYRAKAAAEEVLALSGVPATVVRATQFHSLAAAVAGALTLGPLALTLGDMAVQPVDAAWVASRLVDVATGPRPDGFARATDLAGPELLTMAEVASALRRHAGKGAAHVVRLPPVGGALRAFSARSNIPGPEAQTGGATFSQWLESRPRGVSAR
jgi:uncharacterized protein YbjT (DUF2867 family)